MANEIYFTWAENEKGEMVSIENVDRGLSCKCVCPYCHEPLEARKGTERRHGFAHHSNTRRATLKICYHVIMYKLAEQIIQTQKRVHAPSYYDIIKESDIEFVDVKVDSRFEREDKQPDVIAIGKDGKEYLIEFVFYEKVQHKQPIDYKNTTCLEIDLSNKTLEDLEEYLLQSNEGRQWLNNSNYFGGLEDRYSRVGKKVRVVDEIECWNCKLKDQCCAIKKPSYSYEPIVIDENCKKYRICKSELYDERIEKLRIKEAEEKQRKDNEEKERIEYDRWREKLLEERKKEDDVSPLIRQQKYERWVKEHSEPNRQIQQNDKSECRSSVKSCFDCKKNLSIFSRKEEACCGQYLTLGIHKYNHHTFAQDCKGFKMKDPR